MSVAFFNGWGCRNYLFKRLADRSIYEIIISDLAGVTTIGSYAFAYCRGLVKIEISDDVSVLSFAAFEACNSLTYVTLGTGITRINNEVFKGCNSLARIKINATIPPTLTNVDAFADTNNCPIYVPAASVNAYKSATNWSAFASRIQAM